MIHMNLLLLLVLFQTPDDHARAVVKRIEFPTAEETRAYVDKGVEYKSVLGVVLKKENWISAVKFLEEHLAPFSDDWTIKVELKEWDGESPAHGDRAETKAVIRFNMKRLGSYERKMIEYRAQDEELRKKGKRIDWKVPPLRYDRLIHHELVHVLQGTYVSPDWFHEGLASWAGDDMNYIKAFLYTNEVVEAVGGKLATEDDVYGRGQLFMKWVESRLGKAGFKTLAKATFIDGGEWKGALEKALKLTWEQISKEELAWTTEYSAKVRPK